jgi:hypothetical protein
MQTRNQQHSNRPSSIQLTPAPAPPQPSAQTLTHLNVFTVEEYENNGKTQKRWTRIGTAFPHKEGPGFSIELRALPMDGRLVILPPDQTDDRTK